MAINSDDLNNLKIALKKIICYFEIPSYYGEIEKEIYTYYNQVLVNCNTYNFTNIDTCCNFRKKYLKINPDGNSSIIQTMKEADFLIKKIKKDTNMKKNTLQKKHNKYNYGCYGNIIFWNYRLLSELGYICNSFRKYRKKNFISICSVLQNKYYNF